MQQSLKLTRLFISVETNQIYRCTAKKGRMVKCLLTKKKKKKRNQNEIRMKKYLQLKIKGL